MAFDFPASPTNGQQFTPSGGQTYTYDSAGTKWTVTGTGLTGLPVLGSGTVSAVSQLDVVLTSFTTYKDFELILNNMRPSFDGDRPLITLSTDGGSTYIAAGYEGSFIYFDNAAATSAVSFSGASGITWADMTPNLVGNGVAEGMSATIRLYNPLATTARPRFTFETVSVTSHATARTMYTKGGYTNQTAQDANAIRFAYQNGTITSGDWLLRGLT